MPPRKIHDRFKLNFKELSGNKHHRINKMNELMGVMEKFLFGMKVR